MWLGACVCVCVCVCARARARTHVCVKKACKEEEEAGTGK